jgi:quinoprotein relay system zinc metallohydrolase 2
MTGRGAAGTGTWKAAAGPASWLVAALFCAALLAAPPGLTADQALPVREVAPGVFVYEAPVALASPENRGAIANLGFVVGRDAVAVIDTGGSRLAGQALLAAIRQHTRLPIRYVVNTHVHPDHSLGNAAFAGSGTLVVGHANLPEAFSARASHYLTANRALIGEAFAGTEVLAPTLLVKDRLNLDLGGRELLLEAWPTAHTNTDLTVRDLATDTWFLGDLLFVQHVPALDGRLGGWIATLRALRARPAARAVPGHGPAVVDWPQAAAPLERYLARLDADLRAMIRDGRPIQEAAGTAARSEAGSWSLFEAFNARNATAAYHELEWE